jgi:hypothetical protein
MSNFQSGLNFWETGDARFLIPVRTLSIGIEK